MAVYAILQQPNHDFTSAGRFGHINLLFPLGVNFVNIDVIAKAARDWFKDFDFQEDVFLPVGNPIVVAVVSMCLVEEMLLMEVDQALILEWDRSSQSYIEKTFTLDPEMEDFV
jgi:hypothetical protein